MKIDRLMPRDGWRVFVGEVGVIVLGVLIALVAQQFAEDWQWRQTVARTKADLDAQISMAIVGGVERAAVDTCLSQRLTDLAAKVAANRGTWTANPYVLPGEHTSSQIVHYAIRPAYRVPGRAFPDDVWQQAKAAGVLTHMSPMDITRYSSAFDNITTLRDGVVSESMLTSELSFLSFDGQLNSSDRVRALSTIAQLDGLNRGQVNAARLLIEDAKSLGGTMSAADEKILDEYLDIQRNFRGPCVDRAAAMRLIAPIRARGSTSAR